MIVVADDASQGGAGPPSPRRGPTWWATGGKMRVGTPVV